MIRIATNADIDTILEVTKSCANHMIDNGIFQWNASYPNRLSFENDVLRSELYVLEIEKTIVGCIVISSLMDDVYKDVKWLTRNNSNLYIHRLAILPSHQGKGYAQKLMDYAEGFGRLKQQKSIRLDTFSQNERNQVFYEKRGYHRLESIYFPDQSEFAFYCFELIL